ncbi:MULTISPECIES: M23 family metallopeptidase [Streptomyces]|uniref:M23 family metallopeptidase n=1 Tax=Streptomyces lycii TaxID=2654337 RepID=A0ABQ7FDH5_9ACTN|nr:MULTISPECIES: M23 family metallopeptidase [Streptomyces]KAF4407101.1 M23 family metallopeptidase [Streptomyces lycii]PGH46962.1 peptidase [Streptomyces sp. Ru87]
MSKHAQILASMSPLHRRAALAAAGLGATAVLGTGAALAQDDAPADTAKSTGTTQSAEAKAGTKAAAKADAEERAGDKGAADRSKRDKPTAASWTKPVDDYTKGSDFGIGGDRWANKHSGQDFVVPTGTSVKAAHTGTVVTAGWGGSYGNNVVIKHGDNTYTQYAHLSKLGVQPGDQLKTGEEIGKSGSTGNSTGPHLHFETRTTPEYGSGVEPVHFLKERGVTL